MTTILATGFGPFPGAPENPSGELIKHLLIESLELDLGGARMVFGTLPASWRELDDGWRALLSRSRPDMALHLGYSPHSPGFELEASSHNRAGGKPDGRGDGGPGGAIEKDGEDRLDSPFDLPRLAEALRTNGHKAEISQDCGDYLCNYLYYRSLSRPLPALFVHIPAINIDGRIIPPGHAGSNILELDQAMAGVRLTGYEMASFFKQNALA